MPPTFQTLRLALAALLPLAAAAAVAQSPLVYDNTSDIQADLAQAPATALRHGRGPPSWKQKRRRLLKPQIARPAMPPPLPPASNRPRQTLRATRRVLV